MRSGKSLLVLVVAAGAVGAGGAPAFGATTVTVAADGSGNYRTVQAAIDAAPANSSSAYTVNIKAGTYRGTVSIPANKPYISLVGTGSAPSAVVIVEGHASGLTKSDGSTYGTAGSATVTIAAANTMVSNLTMSNDFNEAAYNLSAEQAVAVNTYGDRVQFSNVRILGNQDTLLVNTSGTAVRRLYVRNSYVEGDVDFIFGAGTMVFQNGEVRSLTRGSSSNNGYITAAATNINNKFGYLFWGTHLTSNAPAKTVYLGRPWHPGGDVNAIAQVLYRGVVMDAHIRDDPWTDMSGFSWRNARFTEYSSTGAGAVVNSNRPQMSASTAAQYTPTAYLAGSDGWNPIH
ncbi:pectinesterase family protein [Dactylosporangium sp. NPDC051541]|uniref:pectinesterase family protein n=1 Tax=Dactylosporangium sp. NPDC051541 TaxID=3363977 RepID=UPI0037A10C08